MTDRRLQHPEKRWDNAPSSGLAMCEGKDGLTHDQAQEIIRRPRKKKTNRVAYKCLKCGRWHIGNPIANRSKRRNGYV